MLAAKFFDDIYYNNNYYARIGGVSCTELNSLEIEFLFLINFNLFVTTENYQHYYNMLVNHQDKCQCTDSSIFIVFL